MEILLSGSWQIGSWSHCPLPGHAEQSPLLHRPLLSKFRIDLRRSHNANLEVTGCKSQNYRLKEEERTWLCRLRSVLLEIPVRPRSDSSTKPWQQASETSAAARTWANHGCT